MSSKVGHVHKRECLNKVVMERSEGLPPFIDADRAHLVVRLRALFDTSLRKYATIQKE